MAIWDPAARTVTCLSCTAFEVAAGPTALIEPGQPGASALREYQRRHDAREQRARERLGGLGTFLVKRTDEPSSTRVWQQGGSGEVRVGARLERLLDGTSVRLLHDRRVPGHGQANIDHIAVGPVGITVIDSKTHRGKIRRDWRGCRGCKSSVDQLALRSMPWRWDRPAVANLTVASSAEDSLNLIPSPMFHVRIGPRRSTPVQ
jgi:hypothetical protein